MKTRKMKIEELLHDPANVRKHDKRNIESIKASLQRFGQQKPIVVDGKGIVVAGNGTLSAARELGWIDISVVETKLEGTDDHDSSIYSSSRSVALLKHSSSVQFGFSSGIFLSYSSTSA